MFGLLLWACPSAFRRTYGAAMRRDFADALGERSLVTGASFPLASFADVLRVALVERSATFAGDLAFAARSVRKAPGLAVIVVATLALAIGANATVFSILRAVVLAPLPYADANRIVAVAGLFDGKPFALSLPDFADLHAQNTSFGSFAAYAGGA